MIKYYFRRNFNLLFSTGIKALSTSFAKYGVVNSFLCEKISFQKFPHWSISSVVIVGMFQATSILIPHNACILVAKNQPWAVSENFATCFSGEWNPIYSSLRTWIVKSLALFLPTCLKDLSPCLSKFHCTFQQKTT